MRKVAIVTAGSGAQARVLYDACLESCREVAGRIKAAEALVAPLDSLPLLGDVSMLDDREFLAHHELAIGVGNEAERRRLAERVLDNGGALATIIHPAAIISRTATIGAGSAVLARTVVGVSARVGRFCIINTAATVDHDCKLADNVNLSPASTCPAPSTSAKTPS